MKKMIAVKTLLAAILFFASGCANNSATQERAVCLNPASHRSRKAAVPNPGRKAALKMTRHRFKRKPLIPTKGGQPNQRSVH
ncbi:MAG TPA: hypothetical protein IAC82_03130 [Candidatus Merdivicinus intestinigallinarum]|nr:hypothetical protein [Candidatus Merdivicinus intestinigallinarum]